MVVRRVTCALAVAVAMIACGSTNGDAVDAGTDVVYGHHSVDAAGYEAEAAMKMPFNRMEPHGDIVLGAPHIRVIYIGTPNVDASPNFDAFFTWLVTSADYWTLLAQYGVGFATFDGSTQVDTNAFFTPGMIVNGLVDALKLEVRIQKVIHAPPPDGGVSDDAGDASDDAGDASVSTVPPIPTADAYVFFLPDGINVNLGGGEQTCLGIGGYHSYDGFEPYALIPPCGHSGLVLAHEMAEMCTDPLPDQGWYSDDDVNNPQGAEIGDLCNMPISVDTYTVTQLWSNKDGDCEPN